MTTQEKLLEIISKGWEIKIYARAHPVDKPQGFLPKHQVYTSEKEGEVFNKTPFCIGYIATKGDLTVAEIYSPFETFINILYDKLG